MPRRRTLSGRSIRVERPEWQPLIDLIGLELVDWFMWMFALELSDGSRVHAYKHRATRRYFHLAEDGRAFAYTPRDRYREIELAEAVGEAFCGWEDVMPAPDAPARAALQKLRGDVAGAASHEMS